MELFKEDLKMLGYALVVYAVPLTIYWLFIG
jgi:hypothetical protein